MSTAQQYDVNGVPAPSEGALMSEERMALALAALHPPRFLVPIAGDGNCFFTAITLQLNMSATALRQRFADEWRHRADADAAVRHTWDQAVRDANLPGQPPIQTAAEYASYIARDRSYATDADLRLLSEMQPPLCRLQLWQLSATGTPTPAPYGAAPNVPEVHVVHNGRHGFGGHFDATLATDNQQPAEACLPLRHFAVAGIDVEKLRCSAGRANTCNDRYDRKQLEAFCRRLNLKICGSKAELIQRISEYLEASQHPELNPAAVDELSDVMQGLTLQQQQAALPELRCHMNAEADTDGFTAGEGCSLEEAIRVSMRRLPITPTFTDVHRCEVQSHIAALRPDPESKEEEEEIAHLYMYPMQWTAVLCAMRFQCDAGIWRSPSLAQCLDLLEAVTPAAYAWNHVDALAAVLIGAYHAWREQTEEEVFDTHWKLRWWIGRHFRDIIREQLADLRHAHAFMLSQSEAKPDWEGHPVPLSELHGHFLLLLDCASKGDDAMWHRLWRVTQGVWDACAVVSREAQAQTARDFPDEVDELPPAQTVAMTEEQLQQLSSATRQSCVREWLTYMRPLAPLLRHVRAPCRMVLTPVGSAGDVYQLLAYVMWCCAHETQPCNVTLCYDAGGATRMHAVRAYTFVHELGYGAYFQLQEVPPSPTYRYSVRQAATEAAVHTRAEAGCVDHRLATVLLSDAVLREGREDVCAILRRRFADGAQRADQPASAASHYAASAVQQVLRALQALPAEAASRPLVVLHYRPMKKEDTNAHQSFEPHAKQLCCTLLAEFNIVVIKTSRQDATLDGALAHLYPMAQAASRLAHLQLLLHLYEQREALRLRAIVGNTSGTLDIAALLGHCVLDLHNFSRPKDDTAQVLAYQSYRLMMQTPWIGVCNSARQHLAQAVLKWLRLPSHDARLGERGTALLRSDFAAPLALSGFGYRGFTMQLSLFLTQAQQQGWQLLPADLVNELLSRLRHRLQAQNIADANAINELKRMLPP